MDRVVMLGCFSSSALISDPVLDIAILAERADHVRRAFLRVPSLAGCYRVLHFAKPSVGYMVYDVYFVVRAVIGVK